MSTRLITLASSIDSFRTYLQAKNASQSWVKQSIGVGPAAPGTVVATSHWSAKKRRPYAGYIGALVDTAGPSRLLRDLRREDLDALFLRYSARPASYNCCLAAVRLYIRFAADYGYMSSSRADDLLKGRDRATNERKEMYYLTLKDYDRALELAKHPQRRAILATAWNTLLRQSEITGMKLRNLNRTEKKIIVWRSKQKKNFDVTISPSLDRELFGLWLPAYALAAGYGTWEGMAEENPDWPVFPRLQHCGNRTEIMPGTPIRHSIEYVAKEVLASLGVNWSRNGEDDYEGQGMHMFRRSAARCLFGIWSKVEGGNRALFRVGAMLGHKDIKTTQLYIGYDPERQELHEMISEADPFDALREAGQVAVIPGVLNAGNVTDLAAFRRAKIAQ